ncbi:MAG: hypothetical protein ACXWDO_00055 [Bacteroidia bacterium]
MHMLKNTSVFNQFFCTICFILIGVLGIYGLFNSELLWLWPDFLNKNTRFNQIFIDVTVLSASLFVISFIKNNKIRLAASAIFFLIFYLSHNAAVLGDRNFWYSYSGSMREALFSELLGSVFYHLIAYVHKPFLISISPFLGSLTALSFLYYTNRLLNESNNSKTFFIIALFYAASPIHLIFFKNFIEYTCTSIVFLPAYVYFCTKYFNESDHKASLTYLVKAVIALSLAMLFHGMNLFVWPVLICCIVLKNTAIRNKAIAILTYVTATAIFCFLVILLLKIFGFSIVPGHVDGGGDGRAIKMLSAGDSAYQFADMHSKAFFMELSNIILLSNFSVPFFLLAVIWFRKKYRSADIQHLGTEVVLMITTLAFIGFIWLWNFDLGFPNDYDLMLSMGIVFTMLTAFFFLKLCRVSHISRYILLQPLVANLVYSWIYITQLS